MQFLAIALLLTASACDALVPSALRFPGRSGMTGVRSAAQARVSMGVGLYYSTSTGNTENVAGYISDVIGVDAQDIADVSKDELEGIDAMIIGAPTWHTGADTERSGTSWDEFLYETLPNINIKGKKVACFGLGDQIGYADNFVDAMGELHDCFKEAGAEFVGFTSTDGYEHEDSKAIVGGKFCGLACDEDNQFDQSEGRVKAWIDQLKGEGVPL